MGTNYYVHTPPCANACDHCHKATEIHLGKGSYGWKFTHRAYREWQPTGLDFPVTDHASWLRLAGLGPIFDEYGQEQNRAEFLAYIDAKQDGIPHDPDDARARSHGVYRRDSRDFVSDGYDFYDGEFS